MVSSPVWWDEMRRVLSHHRVHSAFEEGHGSTERVIKTCIIAFPSLWVSCNAML
jgi:hypothetical protein